MQAYLRLAGIKFATQAMKTAGTSPTGMLSSSVNIHISMAAVQRALCTALEHQLAAISQVSKGRGFNS